MKTIEMPKMGDTMEEGKILRWIKHEGDQVKKGESLAEVETDKVNIEIESFASGILRKILVPEGASAPIGAGIALVGAPDEPLPENTGRNGAAKSASAGVHNSQNDNRTPAALAPNQTGMTIENSMVPQPTAATINNQAPATGEHGRIFISPIARRLAEEHRIDYSHIRGTGPNGRIIKMDIEAAVARAAQRPAAIVAPQPAAAQAPPVQPEPAPAAIDAGEVVEIPLTSMRRTIAKRLSQSMQTAPHFYVTSVIDTGKLADLRQQINAYAANDLVPVKISFNDLIIKAVARVLVRMPQVNISFAEDRLIQKKFVHIGMAVALEQGLIVPVLHNVDRQGILDIARESQRLAEEHRIDYSHIRGTGPNGRIIKMDIEAVGARAAPRPAAAVAPQPVAAPVLPVLPELPHTLHW